MIWPFFGAVALASGTLVERIVLMKKSISVKAYQFLQFLAIVIVMLPFIPFFWRATQDAYTTKNILIFISVIVLSMFANYFTFYSMKWEKLGKLEPAKITEPLFVILLAFLFSFIFGNDLYGRNPNILIPAIISAVALIFSNIKKNHLEFSKYFIAAVIGSFFFAAELVISRLILDFYNPITFYFLRCVSILILSFIFFIPKISKKMKTKTKFQILATGAIWFIYRIIIYFGYTNLGVVETTLTIMLGPVFVYLFAWKFLKEKIKIRNVISSIIIIACVIYVSLAK